MADEHVVEIIQRRGDFMYRLNGGSPQEFLTFRVRRGDTITWICQKSDAHFAVDCGYDSPFPTRHFQGRPGQTRVGDKIRTQVPEGRYKYTVAVWDDEGVWTDDPEFIIRG